MNNTLVTVQANDVSGVQEAVRDARRILPVGAKTKPALSIAPDNTLGVDMRGLSGIVEYEPAEYTITALAGTPVREVTRALYANDQYLPFDPVLIEAGATVGGTVGSGLSGPCRLRYGGIRDFILGTRFVDGRGNLIQGGGKVVKNAAGFDFPKLLVGSFGRLGIIVDATFKVFPRPAAYVTVLTDYADINTAVETIQALSASPVELLAVDLALARGGDTCSMAVRLGGLESLLLARADRLRKSLPESTVLEGGEEHDYWRDVNEFRWAESAPVLVKVPLTPQRVALVDQALADFKVDRRYSVAANVLWIAWNDTVDLLHDLLALQGLTGVVLRGECSLPLIGRNSDSAFADRVKAALDPENKFLSLFPV